MWAADLRSSLRTAASLSAASRGQVRLHPSHAHVLDDVAEVAGASRFQMPNENLAAARAAAQARRKKKTKTKGGRAGGRNFVTATATAAAAAAAAAAEETAEEETAEEAEEAKAAEARRASARHARQAQLAGSVAEVNASPADKVAFAEAELMLTVEQARLARNGSPN